MSTSDLRSWLRALPTFDRETLPTFDPDAAPTDPCDLFLAWLREAVDAGLPIAHSAVLSTADLSGTVSARTLILKDVDSRGWHVATSRLSPKARDLEANPQAAMTFLWGALGRQVRLAGPVTDLGPDAGAADFLARPERSRAAALVGHQSEPLATRQEYRGAYDRALQAVRADPALVAPEWRVYALAPHTVEFWQETPDTGQIRLRYRASADTWTPGLVWP